MPKADQRRSVKSKPPKRHNDSPEAIPKEVALQLCGEIQQQYYGQWYTLAGAQCWACLAFSQGDPTKMCFNQRPGYRGCKLVNARYDRLPKRV